MTNPMFNPQPNYSGVTIQIANPTVNAGANNGMPEIKGVPLQNSIPNNGISGVQIPAQPYYTYPNYCTDNCPRGNMPAQPQVLAYPPQYYLNNYNYPAYGIENKENKPAKMPVDLTTTPDNNIPINDAGDITESDKKTENNDTTATELKPSEPQDFTKSQNIIDDLDARDAKAKAEKENSTPKNVVALTDEYIKSLENYLNNPNEEIRLMASKEILTRLDEDKSRYNDLALNALLNKMLQDPSKLIRIAALSAFSSQLASGNDYTIELLHNIQQNPNADKEDVLQAADILLKMSAGTEVKNIPNPAAKEDKKG